MARSTRRRILLGGVGAAGITSMSLVRSSQAVQHQPRVNLLDKEK